MAGPIKKIRMGYIEGAIFENERTYNGKKGTTYSATIGRRYKDKGGNYQSSNSYSRTELLQLEKVAERCGNEIDLLNESRRNGNDDRYDE